MAYCSFEFRGDVQVCSVCGASFESSEPLRVVCGVQRPKGPPPPGAGTHLKRLLASFGIKPSPNCKCASKAQAMDYKGIDWCEENIETIVEWLKEEADSRGFPFIRSVGRLLVRRAIRNARAESERLGEGK